MMSVTFGSISPTGNVVKVALDPVPKDGREARKRIADELANIRPDLELQGSIHNPIKPGVYMVCYGKR